MGGSGPKSRSTSRSIGRTGRLTTIAAGVVQSILKSSRALGRHRSQPRHARARHGSTAAASWAPSRPEQSLGNSGGYLGPSWLPTKKAVGAMFELANRTRPPARNTVPVAPWHQSARHDWNDFARSLWCNDYEIQRARAASAGRCRPCGRAAGLQAGPVRFGTRGMAELGWTAVRAAT
jgi:hypothetical protein